MFTMENLNCIFLKKGEQKSSLKAGPKFTEKNQTRKWKNPRAILLFMHCCLTSYLQTRWIMTIFLLSFGESEIWEHLSWVVLAWGFSWKDLTAAGSSSSKLTHVLFLEASVSWWLFTKPSCGSLHQAAAYASQRVAGFLRVKDQEESWDAFHDLITHLHFHHTLFFRWQSSPHSRGQGTYLCL